MTISAFDLFKVGIGPSSSHTVGPMRAACLFARRLDGEGALGATAAVRVELFGSLGATGHGHGTVKAVTAGLAGQMPDTVDPEHAQRLLDDSLATGSLAVLGKHEIGFDPGQDIVLHRRKRLEFHSNAMTFLAIADDGTELARGTYYSVGGGFVVDEAARSLTEGPGLVPDPLPVPFPFTTGAELLAHAERTGLAISDIVLHNECARRPESQVREGLLDIWRVMRQCTEAGMRADGVLPGGLKVRRRAGALRRQLTEETGLVEPADWVTLYALAVNEENAAGGRVVTAPTNGAAGIIPAVLRYYQEFIPGADDDGIVRFLLVAAGIGILFKENASISGAEVGCQGEVGSACSMAAGALAEVLGGSPRQVENAAEIGIEHNLGLTCDPVGGLVQIPCIERNAIASIKAITAARLAVRGDGTHHVSLDKAIKTMRETGADMKDKYKETARGGLALNVVEC
ncbi:L-serine ammonia-lyase [Trebonia kvetii]|uniref:L-serine dehydratase n=1 Tax=Trebonia kvetii TaxID=2480626 RepID=A0A6P2C2C5_9ACTN|nr:L-serine ammonia-lyase [Trebonia kvetii]TVZ05539.1 L-serine ammonia-lyase [Trebonia kvetii]